MDKELFTVKGSVHHSWGLGSQLELPMGILVPGYEFAFFEYLPEVTTPSRWLALTMEGWPEKFTTIVVDGHGMTYDYDAIGRVIRGSRGRKKLDELPEYCHMSKIVGGFVFISDTRFTKQNRGLM